MKISKLFHWLYAIVMLLPVFAIASTILVNTFNKEITQPTQEVEVNYKYETNEVNSNDDLIIGNCYKLLCVSLLIDDFIDYDSELVIKLLSPLSINADYLAFDEGLTNISVFSENLILRFFNDNDGLHIYTYNSEQQYFDTDYSNSYYYESEFESNCYFVLIDFTLSNVNLYNFVEISDYLPIESVEITEQDTSVNNIFYYAVDKVTESPLFSWSYNSFLTAPFSYIVVLFGMPTNHVVVELLSYWLAISIIWLVFDLVMYVPLLVHRWLDKGVLE